MSEYEQYVQSVNRIFEIINRMKSLLPDQDNLSLIENIEQYKQVVITNANLFSNQKVQKSEVEALGND